MLKIFQSGLALFLIALVLFAVTAQASGQAYVLRECSNGSCRVVSTTGNPQWRPLNQICRAITGHAPRQYRTIKPVYIQGKGTTRVVREDISQSWKDRIVALENKPDPIAPPPKPFVIPRDIEEQWDNRISLKIQANWQPVEQRLSGVEKRVEGINSRLDGIEATLKILEDQGQAQPAKGPGKKVEGSGTLRVVVPGR